jgi:AcrR family transcriptional regulator
VLCKRKNESPLCPLRKFSDKKQQAFEEREALLLTIAEGIMETEGFSGLTMDKLVAACAFSKGTVYNHFNSKEDLLSALCIKSMIMALELFKKARKFAGGSREKLLAIHYAYRLHALSHPTLFLCVLTSRTPAIREKASAARLLKQEQLDKEMTHYCDELFELGMQQGELPQGSSTEINQLVFAAWAMSFGTNALLSMANQVEGVQRLDANMAVLQNANLLMDGMAWQPLSRQVDYLVCWQRIGQEIFKQELVALGQSDIDG